MKSLSYIALVFLIGSELLRGQSDANIKSAEQTAPAAEIEYVAFFTVAGHPMVAIRQREGRINWATIGSMVSDHKIDFIEDSGKYVVVSKGGRVQQLTLPDSRVKEDADRFVTLPHDLALTDARAMVETLRSHITGMPGYKPYDPTIEKAYGPGFVKSIAEQRALHPESFTYAFIRMAATSTGSIPVPGITQFETIVADPNLRRKYSALTPQEIRQLDLELTPLFAVRFQLEFTAREEARAKAATSTAK